MAIPLVLAGPMSNKKKPCHFLSLILMMAIPLAMMAISPAKADSTLNKKKTGHYLSPIPTKSPFLATRPMNSS